MEETREISALLNLIDDPDEEVFGAVSEKIIGYGRIIIPNLEHLWETTPSEDTQDRIEQLIHRLHYKDLTEDFKGWDSSGYQDLKVGALLAAKFQYPELPTTPVVQEVEKLRRNIWLELNNYLTPLEQLRIVTGILYGYYGLKGNEVTYDDVNDFLIHKTLESKKGNQLSNGILYLVLCDLLDIPVKAISIPRQFVLAYYKSGFTDRMEESFSQVEFFLDPASGQVISHKDIESYFKRISVPPVQTYFKPLSNKRVIQVLLEEMAKCFGTEKDHYKNKELLQLAALLD